MFIIKGAENLTNMQSFLSDGTTTQIDTIPSGVIALYGGGSNLQNDWTLQNSPTKYFTPISASSNIIQSPYTQTYVSTSTAQVNSLQNQWDTIYNNYESEVDAFSSLGVNVESVYPRPAELDTLNQEITAYNQSIKNLNTANTSAQTALNTANPLVKSTLDPLFFISHENDNTNENTSAISQLVLDNLGNMSAINPIPLGTIILWNDSDDPPNNPPAPFTPVWQRADEITSGAQTLYGMEKTFSIPPLNPATSTNSSTSSNGLFGGFAGGTTTNSPGIADTQTFTWVDVNNTTQSFSFSYSLLPPGISFYFIST